MKAPHIFKHCTDHSGCIYGLNSTQEPHLMLGPLFLISDLEAIVFTIYSVAIDPMWIHYAFRCDDETEFGQEGGE